MNHTTRSAAAVIGAGPYGLSIAAHLRSAGTDFRIFGKPMDRWLSRMPEGMFLKSEGHASSLSDPEGSHTLARFCAEEGLPYDERAMPVPIGTFTRYALSFQRKLVPEVEQVMVTRVEAARDGFDLQLADGSTLHAGRVVVATGLEHTAYTPPVFAGLPPELVSHCQYHRSLSRFRGSDVTVIGGGQSALETAALLAEEGASVRVVVRRPAVAWNEPPRLGRRSLYQRLLHPLSPLGEGLQLWLYSAAPMLFYCCPRRFRLEKVKTSLTAAGAYWLRSRVEGRIQILPGRFVSGARPLGGRAALKLAGADGQAIDLTTDHVIAATGYRFDAALLPFLGESIKTRLRTEEGRPRLSPNFESTVSGLYFTGFASANSFGPPMRFIAGTDYTARRVSRHVAAARGASMSISASPSTAPSALRAAPARGVEEI